MTTLAARSLAAWARILAVSVLLLALASGHARAFQLPNRFLESAESGGGGGRLFTGSPIDHYT